MAHAPRSRRILVVDDNREIHADFRKLLGPPADDGLRALEDDLFGTTTAPAREGYEIDGALQGEEGLRLVERALADGRPYALAFVDMRMPPGWDGVTTVEHLFRADPDLQVVICTAYSERSWEEIDARFPGSDRLLILRKPFDVAEVCQLAAALTAKWELGRRANLKRAELEAIVAERTSELRRTNHALTESQATFRRAAEGARDGLWDWDLRTGQIYYSPRWRGMLGLPEGEGYDGLELWFGNVVLEDREALERALDDHFQGRTPYVEIEHRVRRAAAGPRRACGR